jgi:hypothetical protein
MISFRCSFLLLLLGSLVAAPAVLPPETRAQQIADVRALSAPTVKEYGRPGYPRMTIYVWGNADTGVWSVERGTDLLEFVSVVSRAQMGGRQPDVRMTQVLSIYRDQTPESGDPYFQVEVTDLFGTRETYPALQEGDILVLDTKVRRRFTWRDIAQVTGVVAAVVNTYLLLDGLGD